MKDIDFSIIVPFYNKEKTIEPCVRSLLSQDYPKDRYEIIFVNNNSSDKSCFIVNKYPFIKLIHEEKQGAYTARNAGILRARGSFMVFTDADAEVKKDWLSNIYLAISKNNYDILIGWYRAVSSGALLQFHNRLISERIKKSLEQRSLSMLTATASNLVVKSEIFKREGFFKTVPRSEDTYFVSRCFRKGYNIGFDKNIEVKRNDIRSLKTALSKDFIYGCANASYATHAVFPSDNLKAAFMMIRFVFKHFPAGMGVLLFAFFYIAGYALGKYRILNVKIIDKI